MVREVMACLYRTNKPWLMILDNLDNKSTLESCLPRGTGNAGGHVLVTSRELLDGFTVDNRVELRCFDMSESLDLLRRAGGDYLDIDVPYCEVDRGRSSSSGGSSSGGGGGSNGLDSSRSGSSGGSRKLATKYVDASRTAGLTRGNERRTAGEVLCERLGRLSYSKKAKPSQKI